MLPPSDFHGSLVGLVNLEEIAPFGDIIQNASQRRFGVFPISLVSTSQALSETSSFRDS